MATREHIVKASVVISPTSGLNPGTITRRALNVTDVQIGITHCGVCHSDKHHRDNDWKDSIYPMVPGHEIVGYVTAIGSSVTRFKVGDPVAVGNMVDSCRECASCVKGTEQYCLNGGPSWVYNGRERLVEGKRVLKPIGALTFGGYSTEIVCEQSFVLRLPNDKEMARYAPLLCAGITMYTPIKYHKVGPGMRVGVAGSGGLGHFAIKLAAKLGAEVTMLTTTAEKLTDAKRLGATHAALVTDEEALLPFKDYFHLILSTIPVAHDADKYLKLLMPGVGIYHVVGNMNEFTQLTGKELVFHGRKMDTSNVGGLADTQEMLDFVIKHNILPDVQIIDIKNINEAIQSMVECKVRYRYVIDINTLKK